MTTPAETEGLRPGALDRQDWPVSAIPQSLISSLRRNNNN
jgi:hypothetical protein